YQFRYTVPALAPCQDASAIVSVILNPVPVADAGPDGMIDCDVSTATLGGSGTSGNAQYQWLLGATLVSNSIEHTTSNPGEYTLLVTNAYGCTNSDDVMLVADAELPFAQSTVKKNEVCFEEKNGSILVDQIVSISQPVLISLNDGPFSAQTFYSPLEPGLYTIALKNATGCTWVSDTIFVKAAAPLSVELGPDLLLDLGDAAVVEAIISVQGSALDTLMWMPLMDSLHAGMPIQEFQTIQSEQIKVEVVDTNGCIAIDRLTVIVQKLRHVYIPNVIQPNSNLNNVLMVYGGKDVEFVESFTVFDRWGEKLFEATDFLPNDPSVYWAGQLNGKDVESGVYVYYAYIRFIDGERLAFKGDVTVLR
ncbi:MAG: gliding motility-associated C-terminal domain-containing protein, partial [Saprospiraceae bacterium]